MNTTNAPLNIAQTLAVSGFDIANLSAPAARVTFDVPVLFNQDGDPIAGIRIVGKNSPEYRAEHHATRANGYQRSAKKSTAIDATTDEGADQLVSTIDSNQKRIALAVAVDWYGFTSGGAEAPLDRAVLAAAFEKYPTWVDRVTVALENDANFLKV